MLLIPLGILLFSGTIFIVFIKKKLVPTLEMWKIEDILCKILDLEYQVQDVVPIPGPVKVLSPNIKFRKTSHTSKNL